MFTHDTAIDILIMIIIAVPVYLWIGKGNDKVTRNNQKIIDDAWEKKNKK